MAITDSGHILKVLSAYNPWWKSGTVSVKLVKTFHRFAYYDAMRRLNESSLRRSIVLTGTRRVGKTTILYQMIENLINAGVNPTKIVYVSLDHPILKFSTLGQIMEVYHENIQGNQDVYYFFDEIQYAKDWDVWLKIIYDLQSETKLVATGSASPALVKGAKESGAGRWSIIQVPALSFYEYCELLKLDQPELPTSLDLKVLLKMSPQERTQIQLQLSKVHKQFIRYLQIGGFPELAGSNDDFLAQQILREDIVDKVLKRDLPSLYAIRSPLELERIFLYLCMVSSSVISIEALTKELQGVTRPTVENYIRYLESASLIYQSWPIDLGGKKVLKASPKIYIADAAIRNAVLLDDSIMTDPVEMGKVVETAVYRHVASAYAQQSIAVGYYRGERHEREIDVVIETIHRTKILFEVKYRENANVGKEDAILKLCHDSELAVIVTKNSEDFGLFKTQNGDDILRIPASALLYLLGHMELQSSRNN